MALLFYETSINNEYPTIIESSLYLFAISYLYKIQRF